MKIILGTAQFGMIYGVNNQIGKIRESNAIEILEYAFSNGINEFDTASNYGNSEKIVGKFLGLKKGIKISSKISYSNLSLLEQTNNSLKNLRIEKLDKLIFHSFEIYKKFQHQIPEFTSLYKGILFEKIGISTYTNKEIHDTLNDEYIDCIQTPYNLLDNSSLRNDIFLKIKSNKKEIDVRSIFLQGLFFKKINDLKGNLNLLKEPLIELNKLSIDFGFSIEEMAIGYVNQKSIINKILIGVDSLSQLKRNIKIFEIKLPDQLIDKIDNIKVLNTTMLNPSNW